MEQQFHRNKSSWNVRSRGTKVSQERKFQGAKRLFHRTKVPQEQKFSLWTFRSRERKCRGTKRPEFAALHSTATLGTMNYVTYRLLDV